MATLGGFSRSVAVSRGCLQWGVLSPLLWCLVVNELLAWFNEGGVYSQGYVDDICLLEVGKFPNTVSELIHQALHTVKLWCDKLSLSINPNKTGLVAFTRKRKLPGFSEPRLFGMTLHRSLSFKYLGVILDSWLTWKEHMDVNVRKAQNSMWACRRVCGVTWSLRPRVVHWLYVTIIRPSVTFASLVWWPGCQMVSAKRKLSRIQRLACLGITGATRTTPTSVVEALICLPPLELVVQSKARSAVHWLWSLGCWSYPHPNTGHSSILMMLQQSDPIFNMGVDVMRPVFSLEPQYRVITLIMEDWTKETGAPPAVKGLIWFTDGSRMREGPGGGVYGQSVWRWLSFSLGRYATVFQAEIFAILACVYEIQSQNRSEKYVSICSDSQAALKALKVIRTGHNTLRRHLQLLGLLDSPLCMRCGVRQETSAHILCECRALASLGQAYLGSFFLEPEDTKSLSLGAIWNFSKVTGLPWFDMGQKRPVIKA